jgi:outer membrane murein-binding lipoprotein Lpp
MRSLAIVTASLFALTLLSGCGQDGEQKKAIEKAERRAEKAEARAEKLEARNNELEKKLAAERRDDKKDDRKDGKKK